MRWWKCCRSRWGGIQERTEQQWFVLWNGWFYTLWVLPHQMLVRLLAPLPWALASFPTYGILLSLCSLLSLYHCHFNTFHSLGPGEGGKASCCAEWLLTEGDLRPCAGGDCFLSACAVPKPWVYAVKQKCQGTRLGWTGVQISNLPLCSCTVLAHH